MDTNDQIDFSKVVPITDMVGDDHDDTELLRQSFKEATSYLESQTWCQHIEQSYFGLGVGGIVAVFLFRITPKTEAVDNYVWVVVGDIPPLYITTEQCPNPATALDGYIGAMEEWAEAASNGKSVEGLPPVVAKPTVENGIRLKKSLAFLDQEILAHYKDDLV